MAKAGESSTTESNPSADENKTLLFLGLATKARKTVSGFDAVSQAVHAGSAYIVICAEDASDATVKKVTNLCLSENVPCRRFSTREKIGRFMGKEDRAVACVIDKGFAERLLKMIPA